MNECKCLIIANTLKAKWPWPHYTKSLWVFCLYQIVNFTSFDMLNIKQNIFKGQMHLRNTTSFAGDPVDVQKFLQFYLNKP